MCVGIFGLPVLQMVALAIRRFQLWSAAILAVGIVGGNTQSCLARAYTVEDMLNTEEVGRIELPLSGHYALFEIRSAIENTAAFSPSLDAFWEIYRTKIITADLSNAKPPALLFPEKPNEGYELGSLSPDGERTLYFRANTGGKIVMGSYDLGTRRNVEFDFTPDPLSIRPLWINASEFASVVVRRDILEREYPSQISAAWLRMRGGKTVTANIVGGGRFASRLADNGHELVLADANNGHVRQLDIGRFTQARLSPDHAWLAAVRVRPRPLGPAPLLPGASAEGDLIIYHLIGDHRRYVPCASCDVVPNSLAWSADGTQLAFLEAAGIGEETRPRLHIAVPRTQTLLTVRLDGLRAPSQQDSHDLAEIAWFGGDLAIRASRLRKRAEPDPEDWYVVKPQAAPKKLFSPTEGQTVTILHFATSAVVARIGDAVAVYRPGRTGVTMLSDARLQPLDCAGQDKEQNGVISAVAPLMFLEAEASGRSHILRYGIVRNTLENAAELPPDTKVLACNEQGYEFIYAASDHNVSGLEVTGRGVHRRELLRINQHLSDIDPGEAVPLSYIGSNGQKLTSWLLLPPGRSSGRVPTIVSMYPGMFFGSAVPPYLKLPNAFTNTLISNPYLLAAHGYAVLLPSMPIDSGYATPEPLRGLSDQVMRAVRAGARAGYIDASRLGIEGWSYGAFGAAGVLAQTHKFKAAILAAGDYDLISAYGTPRIDDRIRMGSEGRDPFMQLVYMEAGQGNMGVPPWRDPQRYARNSPILLAQSITTPVMLLHGDLDGTVSYAQSDEMFSALLRLNKDVEFVRYWGEGHKVASSPANIRDYWTKVLWWFDRYIGRPTVNRAEKAD